MHDAPGTVESLRLFLLYNGDRLVAESLRHILIVAYSLPFAVVSGAGLGMLVAGRPRASRLLLGVAGIIMTVPGLALFGLMVVLLAPLGLGLGPAPAVAAITLYALLPIARNTVTALNTVDPGMVNAARGLGLSERQILLQVKLPLSVPVIMAGIRGALVLGVGVAAFAFLVAGGGLGYFVFAGVGRSHILMTASGALLVSALGILLNYALLKLEDILTPRGVKIASTRDGARFD